MTYAPAHPATAHTSSGSASRSVFKWIVALALFFSLFAFFAAVQLFQLTTEGAAERTLQRSLAAVSEIDVLLDRHYDDLRERADAVGPDETLELQDYPVLVPLTAAEVQSLSREELRTVLIDRGAARLYADGTNALRDDASTGDPGTFTVGGSVDLALDLLREDIHNAALVLMIVLGAISLVLTALLVGATRNFGRVVAVGAVAFAASFALLLLALLSRFSLRADGETEYVRAQVLDIGREVVWLPVQNAAILTLAFAIVVATGIIAAKWHDLREPASP